MKIKFHEYKHKGADGFVENRTAAYLDVTSQVKDMMDNVNKAYYVLDDDYSFQKYGETEEEAKKNLQNSVDVNKTHIALGGDEEIVVKFKSGKAVSFFTSEWATLGVSKMNMFEA